MADIAARRESRRRKILENSTSRLQLITGKYNGSIKDSEDLSNKVQNIRNENSDLQLESAKCLENHVHAIPDNCLNTSKKTEKQVVLETSTDYLNYSKMYVISLAIIIRLLFIFQMQFCIRDSIILPFILFELPLQFLKSSKSSETVFNRLLLLGLPQNYVRYLSRILRLAEHFLKDFSLYFFTFLILHVCLEFLI